MKALKNLKELQALKELNVLKELKERKLMEDIKELKVLQDVKSFAKGVGEKNFSDKGSVAVILAAFFGGIILGMLISPKGDRLYGCDCGNNCGGCGCCEEEKEEA